LVVSGGLYVTGAHQQSEYLGASHEAPRVSIVGNRGKVMNKLLIALLAISGVANAQQYRQPDPAPRVAQFANGIGQPTGSAKTFPNGTTQFYDGIGQPTGTIYSPPQPNLYTPVQGEVSRETIWKAFNGTL